MSGTLQGAVGGTAAYLTGSVGIAGTVPVSGTVTANIDGIGSGDLVRPVYSVMQALNVVTVPVAAGATVALITPASGIFIEDMSISGFFTATAASVTNFVIFDGATVISRFYIPVTTAAAPFSPFNITGTLKKYLSPNVASTIAIAYSAVAGAGGALTVNMTYATTAQRGP